MGISVAMDDFGTGYSSLATLHAFPFDKIKLDQSFVKRLPDDAAAAAIVRTVLALGESLGIPVLAEGIETEAQWQFLAREGCAKGQGYLFARPVSLAQLPAAIEAAARFVRDAPRPQQPSAPPRRPRAPYAAPTKISNRSQSVRRRASVLGCPRFEASDFLNRTGERDGGRQEKRGGMDRALIALSEAYEVAYWSKKLKITPAKLKAAVKKAGVPRKTWKPIIKVQKHKAADRARIA